MRLSRLVAAVRNLVRGTHVERDLHDELESYVALAADEQVARGLSPEEALRAARLATGGVEQVKERVRSDRAGHWFEEAWHDARYGLRLLRRSPAFALVAIVTLALGIGANAAIFSVLHAVLFKPLNYPNPERLVEIYGRNRARGWYEVSLSHGNFWDLVDQAKAFDAVGGVGFGTVSLTGLELPERLQATLVSAGLFTALGAPPSVGRYFRTGEDRRGGDTHVAVLAHSFWSRRFGADPHVIGRTLTLDGEAYRVVGVAPPDSFWLGRTDVFLPLVRMGDDDRGSFELAVVGRLRAGVSAERATADLDRVADILRRRDPAVNEGFGLYLEPSSTWVATDSLRRSLWMLMGAVVLLLLIACVNLSNMLLARSAARTRETALRTTFGATRGRLARQMLVEAGLLTGLGACAGLALASWLLMVTRRLEIEDVPRLADVALNGYALAFTIVTVAITTVLIALVPALQSSAGDLVPALRDGERGVAGGAAHHRVRHALVGAEVALSLILLIGAGLLFRSLEAALDVDRGFATNDRFFAGVSVPTTLRTDKTGGAVLAFQRNVLEAVATLPGVRSAAFVTGRPLVSSSTGMGIGAPGAPHTRDVPWATWRMISGGYFETMGVPLLQGRVFTEQDRVKEGQPMRVIVSKRVADLLWPGERAVGRTITLWKGQGDPPGEVVGVVGNMRERGLASNPTLAVYLPYYGNDWSPIQLVVHAAGDPDALLTLLKQAVSRVDPRAPVAEGATLDSIVSGSLASRRLITGLLGGFAAVALTLALVGIYGVLAYMVSRRTAEIGMRMALGASRGSVVRLVVTQGLRPVCAGIVVGLLASLALSSLIARLLFGVEPNDPITYVGLAILLAAAAAAACIVPAHHASTLDVTTALRAE